MTGYLAFRQAPKLNEHRKLAKKVKQEMLEEDATTEEFRRQSLKNGVVYLRDLSPVLIAGGVTIGCIFGLNGIAVSALQREAAATAAGVLAEQSYRDLKAHSDETVVREHNERRARKVYSDVRMYPGYGDLLCFETYTGRYFWCTRDRVSIAEAKANEHLAKTGECSINYFCQWLDLEPCPAGDISGWTTFNGQDGFMDFNGVDWINFRHDSFLIDETQTVLMIDYGVDTPPGIIV